MSQRIFDGLFQLESGDFGFKQLSFCTESKIFFALSGDIFSIIHLSLSQLQWIFMSSKEGLSFAKTEITINGKDTASIAGLLLTTECVIVDKPEPKEEHDHAHPGMGGMGGMY